MNKPEVWALEKLMKADLGKSAIWIRPRWRRKVEEKLSPPIIEDSEEPPRDLDTLVVVGGGILIDRAKVWRKENAPATKLIVVPSIWGSGAENSPIAILNVADKKVIYMGSEFLPDVRVSWDELAKELPAFLVKNACGDVWAHALEGFLSPVAGDAVRDELALVVKSLESLPVRNDPAWFEISARACAGQAKSSVGLVHGIAHTLEGAMKRKYAGEYVGHAQLCAAYLWPVFSLNMQLSPKVDTLFEQYGLDKPKIVGVLKGFFDGHTYDLGLPILQENWQSVLRDASTRTNCALIRPAHISYFASRKFE